MTTHRFIDVLDKHEKSLAFEVLAMVSPVALGHARTQAMAKAVHRVLMDLADRPITQASTSMGRDCLQDGRIVPFGVVNLLMNKYLVLTSATNDEVTYSISLAGRAVVNDVKKLLGILPPPPPPKRAVPQKRERKFVVQPTPRSTGKRKTERTDDDNVSRR